MLNKVSKRTEIIAGVAVVGVIATIASAIKDHINSKDSINNNSDDHLYDQYFQNEDFIPDEMKSAQKDAIYSIGAIDTTAIIVDKVKDKLDKSSNARKFIKKCFEEAVAYYTSHNLMVSLVDIYGYSCIIVTEWENDNKLVEILLPREVDCADILNIDQIAIMMLS